MENVIGFRSSFTTKERMKESLERNYCYFFHEFGFLVFVKQIFLKVVKRIKKFNSVYNFA
jgi:hypothetical protein